ncbi:MAG TPA: hypothetical protein VJT32_05935 [bacterium]|nr:hypothetical protein [bacterium]
MADRGVRMLVLGILVGGVAAVFLLGSTATGWERHAGSAASDRDVVILPVRPAQGSPFTPKEFVPLLPPNNGQDQGPGLPSPGASGQDCNKILYFFQGKLYQLRPGPMPRGGGNPEFYYMQPYGGPQIPGFPSPGPMIPGAPGPSTPDQSVPPRRI